MEPTYEITPEPSDDERKVIILALERARLEALGYRPGVRDWRRGATRPRVPRRDQGGHAGGAEAPEAGTAS